MTIQEQLTRIDNALASGDPWECRRILQEYRAILEQYLVLDDGLNSEVDKTTNNGK